MMRAYRRRLTHIEIHLFYFHSTWSESMAQVRTVCFPMPQNSFDNWFLPSEGSERVQLAPIPSVTDAGTAIDSAAEGAVTKERLYEILDSPL